MTPEAQPPSDQELVERTLGGMPDSYGMLYQRYSGPVLRCCVNILDGDEHTAEDLTQEAFIKARLSLSKLNFDQPLAFKVFVLRIATNLAIDKLRRWKRRRNIYVRRAEREQQRYVKERDPVTKTDWQEFKSRLYEAILKIPDDLARKCVIDHFIHKVHRIDICRTYKINKNRFYYLLRKGCKFVRKELERDGYP